MLYKGGAKTIHWTPIQCHTSLPLKCFFLKWAIPSLFFFIFVFSVQLTVNNVQYKFGRWLDSNHGPLVLEATALPTEPQPLPNLKLLSYIRYVDDGVMVDTAMWYVCINRDSKGHWWFIHFEWAQWNGMDVENKSCTEQERSWRYLEQRLSQ